MSENNIKPTDIKSLYKIIEDLTKKGLSYEDILKLIQRRTHPQMSLKSIKNILNALKKLEKDVIFNQKRLAVHGGRC